MVSSYRQFFLPGIQQQLPSYTYSSNIQLEILPLASLQLGTPDTPFALLVCCQPLISSIVWRSQFGALMCSHWASPFQFTVLYASYLITYPHLTLRADAVAEKQWTEGRMDRPTHTHTQRMRVGCREGHT